MLDESPKNDKVASLGSQVRECVRSSSKSADTFNFRELDFSLQRGQSTNQELYSSIVIRSFDFLDQPQFNIARDIRDNHLKDVVLLELPTESGSAFGGLKDGVIYLSTKYLDSVIEDLQKREFQGTTLVENAAKAILPTLVHELAHGNLERVAERFLGTKLDLSYLEDEIQATVSGLLTESVFPVEHSLADAKGFARLVLCGTSSVRTRLKKDSDYAKLPELTQENPTDLAKQFRREAFFANLFRYTFPTIVFVFKVGSLVSSYCTRKLDSWPTIADSEKLMSSYAKGRKKLARLIHENPQKWKQFCDVLIEQQGNLEDRVTEIRQSLGDEDRMLLRAIAQGRKHDMTSYVYKNLDVNKIPELNPATLSDEIAKMTKQLRTDWIQEHSETLSIPLEDELE